MSAKSKGKKPERARYYPPGRGRLLFAPGEDVSVMELIDRGAKLTGVAPDLLEELTVADLMHLGVRVRQAPA